MELSIAFSPCPNDTFIFDALVNHKIDTQGIQFNYYLEDVETLNTHAITSTYDVSKISFGAYPLIKNEYVILDSGSALGVGVGPLLVSNLSGNVDVENSLIAIPGENTTAHFLFSIAYPKATRKIFLRYDEIEDFVSRGKGLGVIIHENRFTYQEKGLHKLLDLGAFWCQQHSLPIPLGGIVIKRNYEQKLQSTINALIQKSIEYAYSNTFLPDFVIQNAQEMSEEVMKKHIALYVNDYTLSMGVLGREAIKKMSGFLWSNHNDDFSLNLFTK